MGAEARRRVGGGKDRPWPATGLVDVLRRAGYEPQVEAGGTVCLRNCPYGAVAADHQDVTCGMNLAWAEGVVDGLGAGEIDVELAPEPGRCCVIFHAEARPLGGRPS